MIDVLEGNESVNQSILQHHGALQVRLMIHLGETLPAELHKEAAPLGWGAVLLLTGLLFPCSLISFGIGAPTGKPHSGPTAFSITKLRLYWHAFCNAVPTGFTAEGDISCYWL